MTDLFLPVPCLDPKSQQAIDAAVVKYANRQREFVWFAISPNTRNEVNRRWQIAEPFCETNFIREFQTKGNFYNRLWELNARYLLSPHLSRKPRNGEPDLIGDKFVAECVVPAPTGVPDLRLDGKLYDFPSMEITRRITTALDAKLQQLYLRLNSSRQQIDYSHTPYVIALNLPDRHYRGAKGMSGMDMVEEVLIGAGPIQITFDRAKNTATAGISSRSTIQSRNDSEINVGLFQRDEYKHVSAVLWSNEYMPELSDLKIMLNPNANVPIDQAIFPEIDNVITYTRTDISYVRDQQLTRTGSIL